MTHSFEIKSNPFLQVKTALDMEIAVYKQLLETEEDRLGITPENGLSNS